MIRVLPLSTNYEEQTQDIEIYGMGASGRLLADSVQTDIYLGLRKLSATTASGAVFVQETPEETRSGK